MSGGIYPVEWAAIAKENAGRSYQPSNGTEGMIFMEAWCCKCERDKHMCEGKPLDECSDAETCQIIANTMAYKPGDPEYPKEWIIGEDGQPCCTAFVFAGGVIPEPHCEFTKDMFGGEA